MIFRRDMHHDLTAGVRQRRTATTASLAGDAQCCQRAVTQAARLFVVLTLIAFFPGAAFAHGLLQSSTPAANTRLHSAPRELRLVFTESPELGFTRVTLAGPNGTVALGPLAPVPNAPRGVVARIRGALTAGTYVVNWQTAGADGHPVRGFFRFVIESNATGLMARTPQGASPPQPPAGEPGASVPIPGGDPIPAAHHALPAAAADAFDAESAAYVAIRWLQFTTLVLVLGALAFSYATLGLLRRIRGGDPLLLPDARRRAAAIGLWSAMILALTAPLRLYAQSYAMHGAERAADPGLLGMMIGRTSWGAGWLLQTFGVLVTIGGFLLARRDHRAGWPLAAVGAFALAATPAFSGHAAAAPRFAWGAIAADTVHVIGAGGWLGGLLLLLAAGIPAAMQLEESARGRAVADLVNAFSPTALLFAGAVGATGVFAAWLHVGGVGALWTTDYGRTLLLKLAILSIVAGTGAYNWLRVRPALGDVEGARRIRRSGMAELAVGVLVLAVTAVLVATPTPRDESMARVGTVDHEAHGRP